jgi:hypothetical protein
VFIYCSPAKAARNIPSFVRGLNAAFFISSRQQPSEPIYRGFFARIKPFWSVLDHIDQLSRNESVA